tara:strand:+ start:256 stop:1008 length:753 start_codon:yes stop_codon:yes gene_type:complete
MYFSKKIKKFKKIKHCFFSKKGGFSNGVYKSLNCGEGSLDKKKNIRKNLTFVSKKMGIKRSNLILMYQTHSNKVIEVKKNKFRKKIRSDAIITRDKKIALGVVTADCVPVLLCDAKNEMVGCIHAGWKGALKGIIKNTVSKIRKNNKYGKIFACIGPCIGRKNYEVGLKFYRKFMSKSNKNKLYFSFKNKNKKLFNLRKFVKDKLEELNVSVDHVNHDTYKERNNFFSYRRSIILKEKDYGRCISVIRLV